MRSIALLVGMIVAMTACDASTFSSREARTLDEMLAIGDNRSLVEKYEAFGKETDRLLTMLEAVGRDGRDAHLDYASELRARGFVLDEATAANVLAPAPNAQQRDFAQSRNFGR